MSLVSKDPTIFTTQDYKDKYGDNRVFRILHLRDAVFLDDMYFRGRQPAEEYLHLHMCKVAGYLSSEFIPMSETALAAKLIKVVNDNKPYMFEIVEV
jgi:hypothetical protein